ncbi:MAG: putative integral rane protein [Gemmatimonadetes bacterium]|nr:putative integral rane protein [Gemmatimonadota bacterium]
MQMPTAPSKRANIALWIAQGLVAALFLMAGVMKFVMPVAEMTKGTPFSGTFMHFIGVCEVLGALGLLLPGITGRYRGLTSLAATGLLIIMIGATVVTATSPKPSQAVMPFVVGILCAVIAYARRGDARRASSTPAPVSIA